MEYKSKYKTAFVTAVFLLIWFGLSWLTGSICWFQSVIGMPCPGCGSTRAVQELLNGNIADALAWHPLIFVSLVLLPYAVIREIIKRKKKLPGAEKYVLIGILVFYNIVFVIRMFLFFPHTQPLVPHEGALWRQVLSVWSLL